VRARPAALSWGESSGSLPLRPGDDRERRRPINLAVPVSETRVMRVLRDTLIAFGLPQKLVGGVGLALQKMVDVPASVTARVRLSAGLHSRLKLVTRGQVRPRFVVGGAAGLAALVLAVAVIAGSGAGPGTSSGAGSGAGSGSGLAGGREENISGEMGSTATPADRTDSSVAPEVRLYPEPEEWAGITGELVARWVRCHASSDAACSVAVVHVGSAADELLGSKDRRHALLEAWNEYGGDSVVVERMGGAVLIDLIMSGTTTASLLVVRSEAGWRLRDVIG
jgi:hypothetical protein